MNQKRKMPFNLEKASWIAAVGGLVFAVYAYEYPSKQEEKGPLETKISGSNNIVVNGQNNNIVTNNPDKILESVDKALAKQNEPNLQTDFMVSFSQAILEIANTGKGIIVVSDIELHWIYEKCKRQNVSSPLPNPGPIPEFRYEVQLTENNGSIKPDERLFKYSPGEIDLFRFALNKPDLKWPDHQWVYHIWATFNYKKFNDSKLHTYTTDYSTILYCI